MSQLRKRLDECPLASPQALSLIYHCFLAAVAVISITFLPPSIFLGSLLKGMEANRRQDLALIISHMAISPAS